METVYYKPCPDCGCKEYSAVISADGYMKILCKDCSRSVAEGYAISPAILLMQKQVREYSDEEVLDHLEFWEQTLAEARAKNNTEAIMLHQSEVNALQGEVLRRGITDKILRRQKDKAKREKEKRRRYRFENRIKR